MFFLRFESATKSAVRDPHTFPPVQTPLLLAFRDYEKGYYIGKGPPIAVDKC